MGVSCHGSNFINLFQDITTGSFRELEELHYSSPCATLLTFGARNPLICISTPGPSLAARGLHFLVSSSPPHRNSGMSLVRGIYIAAPVARNIRSTYLAEYNALCITSVAAFLTNNRLAPRYKGIICHVRYISSGKDEAESLENL